MKPTDNQPAPGVLRTAALIALAVGAIGTIVFMLRVGIRLFSARNIDDVTVDEIAAAADVGKGTIYT